MSNNQIQIFIRVQGFNNARGSVYIMSLVLPLAGLQFHSMRSELSVFHYRLKHLTVLFVLPSYARVILWSLIMFFLGFYAWLTEPSKSKRFFYHWTGVKSISWHILFLQGPRGPPGEAGPDGEQGPEVLFHIIIIFFDTLFKVSGVYSWHFCACRTNQTWLNPSVPTF